jgi:hypothetical protein
VKKALRRIVLAVAAGALAGAATAPDPRSYETEWMVTPDVPAGDLAERDIDKDSVIFRQRIVFEKLGVADVALTEAANGEVFMPAGEQYYRASTGGIEVWCTANMKMPEGALATTVIGRVYSQYCIIDDDKDGVFDSFFKRARTIEVLPTVRGKVTPSPRPIRPLRLSAADPASLRTDYFVGMKFLKNVGPEGGKRPRLQVVAGSEFGEFLIDASYDGPAGSDQQQFLGGATIRYSVVGDRLKILSVKRFPAGPLTIKGTNCGMINGC